MVLCAGGQLDRLDAKGGILFLAAVTAAVAQGELTVREAPDVAQLVDAYVCSVEASDLEKRLRAIEENLK